MKPLILAITASVIGFLTYVLYTRMTRRSVPLQLEMHTVLVDPDQPAGFVSAMLELAKTKRREAGCVRFEIVRHTDAANVFVVTEVRRTSTGFASMTDWVDDDLIVERQSKKFTSSLLSLP